MTSTRDTVKEFEDMVADILGNCKCRVCGGLIALTEPIYCYDDNDGVEWHYHMACYVSETHQGLQGHKPTKIYPPIRSE